jgi:hypothetical protein
MRSLGGADERRLRTEVALVTGIDPGLFVSGDAPIGRHYPGGEMQVMGSSSAEDPRLELEAGVEAALAARLLTQDEAAWLRELTRLCRLPPTPVTTTEERRAALERLLERLVAEAGTEESGMADMRVRLALDTAAALGLLDEENRRRHEGRLEQLYDERAAERAADGYDDIESEPLTAFKGIAPGPEERNGRRVIAVECFDEGLVVRWEVRHELPAELRGRPEGEVYERFRPPEDSSDLAVLDDLGTLFRPGGGSGTAAVISDCWVSSWVCRVRPGLSPGTSALTVTLNDESFEVDVSGIPERPAV